MGRDHARLDALARAANDERKARQPERKQLVSAAHEAGVNVREIAEAAGGFGTKPSPSSWSNHARRRR
ncbi:hypothetical protein [Miltoncostaea oceani]|uniref:hypothetical protein n=1 Tax=Miltoncostaea oceani TaxID=2843216 RepID=UPI001C3C45C4|nr:hypothetical protein [Miltoncostaea oceani]